MFMAVDHVTMAPEVSLHFKVIDFPYKDGEEAFEAIAADQINCVILANSLFMTKYPNLPHWGQSGN